QQSKNSLPVGPCSIIVHMTSVWVPFTSESKEALAHYPEIIKEIKLGLQDAGRKLASFVNKKRRIGEESKKRGYIEKYIPHVADALKEIIGFDEIQKKKVEDDLAEILEHTRGELEEIGVDNPDYDEELAKIGSEEDSDPEESEDEEVNTKKKKGKKSTDKESEQDEDDENNDSSTNDSEDDSDNDSEESEESNDEEYPKKKKGKQTTLA
ncbi:hypothetical protein HYT52_03210, partial [Candidatus Woesearchaeota archaeon]|nr:hypothetical protein [Candidatus Woesearchaeota archaeon]